MSAGSTMKRMVLRQKGYRIMSKKKKLKLAIDLLKDMAKTTQPTGDLTEGAMQAKAALIILGAG